MKFLKQISSTVLALALILLPAVVATRPAQAQTFTVLHTFTDVPDGSNPPEEPAAGEICRKYLEPGPNAAPTCLGLRNEGTTAILCTSLERTSIRSDSHIGAAWPGRGLCQGSRPLGGAQ
jgi:hypothetical protein